MLHVCKVVAAAAEDMSVYVTGKYVFRSRRASATALLRIALHQSHSEVNRGPGQTIGNLELIPASDRSR